MAKPVVLKEKDKSGTVEDKAWKQASIQPQLPGVSSPLTTNLSQPLLPTITLATPAAASSVSLIWAFFFIVAAVVVGVLIAYGIIVLVKSLKDWYFQRAEVRNQTGLDDVEEGQDVDSEEDPRLITFASMGQPPTGGVAQQSNAQDLAAILGNETIGGEEEAADESLFLPSIPNNSSIIASTPVRACVPNEN